MNNLEKIVYLYNHEITKGILDEKFKEQLKARIRDCGAVVQDGSLYELLKFG